MGTDSGRGGGRPRGAVLWPLGLLLTAVASGFGMWHALMRDGSASGSAYVRIGDDRLLQGTSR
jgi:hypothetical protein